MENEKSKDDYNIKDVKTCEHMNVTNPIYITLYKYYVVLCTNCGKLAKVDFK